ncbi:hypothetical protein [Alkalimonas sp.]|uniref:hypothetical protein n=1 Tax=Alkalimonas sp. TaxID=1872453 RepID=UPI00263ADE6E|nr:hypothetical protein [Alkalimonas sp.]MCC5825457.1 hypothetical protein [Alkalimonas sp.]
MELMTATQQLRATEVHAVTQGRQEQRSQVPANRAASPTLPAQASERAQLALQRNRIEPTAIETGNGEELDEEQALEEKAFNAYQTVGMVKRILEQLSNRQIELYQLSPTADKPKTRPAELANNDELIRITEWEFGYQAVSASFSGSAQLANGQQVNWDLSFQMEYSWASMSNQTLLASELQDPLVISLNGMPAQLTGDSFSFDLFNTGVPVQLPNLAAQQFYLGLDRTGNGRIESGAELFGPRTGEGFAELAAYDLDGNGFIDQQDAIWQDLYLWRPDGQQLSMAQAQIGAVSVQSVPTRMPLFFERSDQLGGLLQRSSVFLNTSGQAGLVQQIDLLV